MQANLFALPVTYDTRNSGTRGFQPYNLTFVKQTRAVLHERRLQANAAAISFTAARAQVALTALAAWNEFTCHRQAIGMQTPALKKFEQCDTRWSQGRWRTKMMRVMGPAAQANLNGFLGIRA